MRPLWVEFPKDVNTFAMDDQFMIGGCGSTLRVWSLEGYSPCR